MGTQQVGKERECKSSPQKRDQRTHEGIIRIEVITMPTAAPTLGQNRVRSGFNPSEDPQVAKLKALAASFIDECEAMKDAPALGNEKNRVLAIAQTEIETAAMYAVKGATFKA